MRRAIELGWKGIGRTSPNPMVGCVIVKDDEIIGEAFHLFSQVDHAETIALDQAGERSKGSTVYVTVEPCCHTGRTPPCTDAIIAAEVSKVVYGIKDPDPRVNGCGHSALEKADIDVVGGVLADEIREQNKFFVAAKEKNRPYITLKWAMTLDGKIATRTGESKWISCEQSRNIGHHLRNIYDAILVGHSTVMIDNPRLDCRVDITSSLPTEIFPAIPQDCRNPVRVVLDALGATCCTDDFQLYTNPGRSIVAIAPESAWDDTKSRDSIDTDKIDLIECPMTGGHIDIGCFLESLVERNIHSVLVEGGSGIHAAFLEAGLADEVIAFIAPQVFGGEAAPSPVAGGGIEHIGDSWRLKSVRHLRVEDDLVMIGKFAPEKGE